MAKQPTWFDRLLAERVELFDRLGKLEVFVKGVEFMNLPIDEQRLIRMQYSTMQTYFEILCARIARAEAK